MKFGWLPIFLLTVACEAPQPTPDPAPQVESIASPKVEVAPAEQAVEVKVEPVRPAYVERDFQPPSCDVEVVDEPFNSKNIDPVYDAAFEAAAKPLKDGMVRVRFEVSLPMAQVLELRKTKAGALKVEFVGGGVRVADGPKQPLYKVEKVKTLEALVWLMGEDVVVQVHDADSGLELLTVHAKDSAPAEGAIAWTGAVDSTLLTSRVACSKMAPLAAGSNPLPRYVEVSTADQAQNPNARREPGAPITSNTAGQEPGAPITSNTAGQEPGAPNTARQEPGAPNTARQEPGAPITELTSRELEELYCETGSLPGLLVEPPWRFIDPDYAKWRDTPPVEVASKLRFDLSYKSPQMAQELLTELHARFPEKTRLEEIGKSSQGLPILALVVANKLQDDDPRPPILINGAYHGDEILSSDIVFDALDVLLYGDDPRTNGWLDRFVFWIVPMVNPDGVNEFLERSQFSGRKNARDLDGDDFIEKREGVDLNRNFPVEWGTLDHEELEEPYGKWYRGPKAGSESETKAMMGLVDRERFVAALSYHTGTTAVLGGYSIDSLKSPSPDESVTLAKVVAKEMGTAPNGRKFRFRKNLYAVEGVDQDWMRLKHGTIALLIEASRGSPVGWCQRKNAILPGRRAWMSLVDELANGRLVRGRATRQDKPALVPVSIEGQRVFNSEIWTTRPRDGRFFRFLSNGQKALLVAGKKVSVGNETNEIEVVLP